MTDARPPLRKSTLPDGSPAYFVSLAQYAANRINPENGKPFTRAAASKWKLAGQIVFVEDDEKPGKQLIDAAASDLARAGQQNPLKRQAPAPGADLSAEAPPQVPEAKADISTAPLLSPKSESVVETPSLPDALQDSVGRAKADSAIIKAKSDQLDLEVKMGALVRVSDAKTRETTRMGELIDTLMQVPIDAAEDANPTDPAQARTAFRDALIKALKRFGAEQRTHLLAAADAALCEAKARATEQVSHG